MTPSVRGRRILSLTARRLGRACDTVKERSTPRSRATASRAQPRRGPAPRSRTRSGRQLRGGAKKMSYKRS